MFQLVEKLEQGDPSLSIWGNTQGPFVKTEVHYHERNGWLIIDRIEAGEIGRLFGFIEPEVWERQKTMLEQELAGLRDENQLLRDNLSVPLAEVIDLVAERAKRRPETPTGEVVA